MFVFEVDDGDLTALANLEAAEFPVAKRERYGPLERQQRRARSSRRDEKRDFPPYEAARSQPPARGRGRGALGRPTYRSQQVTTRIYNRRWAGL